MLTAIYKTKIAQDLMVRYISDAKAKCHDYVTVSVRDKKDVVIFTDIIATLKYEVVSIKECVKTGDTEIVVYIKEYSVTGDTEIVVRKLEEA